MLIGKIRKGNTLIVKYFLNFQIYLGIIPHCFFSIFCLALSNQEDASLLQHKIP